MIEAKVVVDVVVLVVVKFDSAVGMDEKTRVEWTSPTKTTIFVVGYLKHIVGSTWYRAVS